MIPEVRVLCLTTNNNNYVHGMDYNDKLAQEIGSLALILLLDIQWYILCFPLAYFHQAYEMTPSVITSRTGSV